LSYIALLAIKIAVMDVIDSVISEGLIPRQLERLARAVPGMRNILVHGYAEVRHDLIYSALKEDLEGLWLILESLHREAERLDP